MTVEAGGDRTVTVPRDLLVALRAEVRGSGAHWAQGFTAAGESLVQHDRRLPDGGCLTCALLEVVGFYLHPPVAAVGPGVSG